MSQGTVDLENESIKDRHISDTAAIDRDKLEQRVLLGRSIPLSGARIWDARHTLLGATPTSDDDLAYVTGTLGSVPPSIQTGDVKTVSKTRHFAIEVPIPDDYEDAETLTIRCVAGMKTTFADGSATIDVQAYLVGTDGTESSDLSTTTAATSINSLTATNKDFVITAASLVKGRKLDVRITIATVDTATGGAVIGVLWDLQVLCDRR